ncbi:MAG: transglycosylase domain-containing protein, partial [Verrucomicrobiota bacterium]
LDGLRTARSERPFVMKTFFQSLSRRPRWQRLFLAAAVGLFLLPVIVYWVLPFMVPLPEALKEPLSPGLVFADHEGKPLRKLLSEGRRREDPVAFDKLPPALVGATLAAEDKRFWSHGGIDFLALGRVFRDRVRYGWWTSGGSTITQQLIKVSEDRPRTLRTKAAEALQARHLEMRWTKKEIFEAYVNRLDYGNLNQGCAAAAEGYFGKPLDDCSVAELALLAGLPQAPSRHDPYRNLKSSLDRRNWVLKRMVACGFLPARDLPHWVGEFPDLASRHQVFEAPHLVDTLIQRAGTDLPRSGTIRTTIDRDLQNLCQQGLTEALAKLRYRRVGQGAVVLIENATGKVRALVGSTDYRNDARSGKFNAALALRSPGSALKPFTYLIGFEKGATPASIVEDLPFDHLTPTGLFEPENFDRVYYGPMTYRNALACSLNVSAVKVLSRSGGPGVLQRNLTRCGVTSLTKETAYYGLGLTLGNAEVSLLELVQAYSCLARLGRVLPYRLEETDEPIGHGQRVFSEANSYLLADILTDPLARSQAFGLHNLLRLPFPMACKTGTSTDFRDAWMVGYWPEYTVGVWMGNPDGSPMSRVTGGEGPARAIQHIARELHEEGAISWYERPASVAGHWIDPLNGLRVDEADRPSWRRRWEWFRQDGLPRKAGPDDVDGNGRTLLGAPYRSWFAGPHNWARGSAALRPEGMAAPLTIHWPVDGMQVYLDPDLGPSSFRLPLEASGGGKRVWSSETLPVEGGYALLKAGQHVLVCRDEASDAEKRVMVRVEEL